MMQDAEQILEELEKIKVKYEPAKKVSGYTMTFENENNRKYAVSRYNPQEEAKKLIEDYEINKQTLWVVLGFGLGYTMNEIINKVGNDVKILIVEPNQEMLDEQLSYLKEFEVQEYPNIRLFAGDDYKLLDEFYNELIGLDNVYNMNVVTTTTYTEFFVKYYKKVLGIINAKRTGLIINQNTIEKMTDSIFLNTLKNREAIKNGYDIRHLKKKYENVPALVVSAGPSLKKNIHLINRFKGIIITGGRSLSAVLEQGIKPHFVVTVDPQNITYDTFKGNTKTDIPLVAVPSANFNIIRDSQGPIYFADNDAQFTKALLGIDIEYISIGGSVATLCTTVAEYMGCNPITFIGQDLAYTNMQAHAESCTIGDGVLKNNVEYKKKNLIKVKDFYNQEVYTDDIFNVYRKWFENFIKSTPNTKYINATEGGAYIEGALHQSLQKTIDQYCNIEDIQIQHLKRDTTDIDMNISLKECLFQIQKLNEYSIEGMRLSNNLKKEYEIYQGKRDNKIEALLRKLDKTDAKITKLERNYVGNLLFSKWHGRQCMNEEYQEPLKETRIEAGIRISKFNSEAYEALKVASKSIIDMIKEEIGEEKNGTKD